jgi:hypothetical protein
MLKIAPENLEIANVYLQCASIQETASILGLPVATVHATLEVKEVKRYIDNVYLDKGYRNRETLGALLDQMIEQKILQAAETGSMTKADLLDLLEFSHKMRIQELAARTAAEKVNINQTNISIGEGFGVGNYGKLMEKLLDIKKVE